MTKDDLRALLFMLHHTTFRNEHQINESKKCGCFQCGKQFNPEDVVSWCDNDGRGDRTALCPYCRIDSVIGDACGFEISQDLLQLMYLQFFGEGIDNVDVTFKE
jgi:hypothetical protein